MKKNKTIICIAICIVLGITLIYNNIDWILSYQSPKKKENAYNQYDEYLKQKYKEEMIINKVEYNSKDSLFIAYVSSKDNRRLNFTVSKWGDNSIKDDYFIKLWEMQMYEKMYDKVEDIFGSQTELNVSISIYKDLYDKYSGLAENLPDYKDIILEIAEFTTINLTCSYDFKLIDSQDEYKKILYLIEYLSDNNILGDLSLYYQDDSLCEIDYMDWKQIKTITSVEKYLRIM